MSTIELSIGLGFPIILMIIGYWKEEVWLFYISSVAWLATMGFLFNNYGVSDYMYYVAWLCLGLSIVCATAQLWMNKGKPMPTETKIEPSRSELRSAKIKRLRNLRNDLTGNDW